MYKVLNISRLQNDNVQRPWALWKHNFPINREWSLLPF